MLLSDLKHIIKDYVTVLISNGSHDLEVLYSGNLEFAPLRVLNMGVGNISVGHDEMHILVFELPFT